MAASVRFLTMRMLSLFLLSFFHLRACHSSPSMQPLCHDDEGHALLQLKESLVINESASYEPSAYPKVASWKADGERGNCCSWDGVECDGDSGHVIGLNLSSSCLYGSIDSNSSLFHLVQLRRLNLADNDFNNSEIPSEIRNLSMSGFTALRDCGLQGEFPMGIFQLPNLRMFSIRYNPYLTGYLPEFQSGSKLETLMLTGTKFSGHLPESLGNLKSLKEFHVAKCYFSGVVPSSLGNLTQLFGLFLSDNKLHGAIPESIYRLQNLEILDLSNNFFSGYLELNRFRNLASLLLSYNNLSLLTSHNATFPLPKLQLLSLEGCNLGELPSFLRDQNQLEAGNLLTGFEQSFDVLPWNNLLSLSLNSNRFQGSLPIPPPAIYEFKVSDNKLNGEIPEVICNLTSLSVLDLSNNNLSGKLPPCLGNKSSTVSVLNLRNNSFSGDIPETFTSGCSLRVVDLSQNKLEGKIPKSLANCTKLEILSLEQNNINDVFPSWLGMLPDLKVLILRCNGLHGVIGKPETNVEFPRLQIVDLSNNSFKGKLPLEYFRNWIAMKNVHNEPLIYMQADTTIDLSSNGFEGGIPEVLGDLKALHLLNLSNNFLSGRIPPSLSNLKELEALDLSQNKLSGEIPVQLAQLTFLEIFNVSHNFLSGSIPRGNQFGAFDNTSFDANSGLCGEPLSKKCRNGEDPLPAPKEDEGSGYPLEFGWKVVVIGYATGLLIGVILGCVMNTRKYEWVVKNYFARWQNKGQYLKNRLRRS
ncbi:receptor-like protein 7 [Populus alba x Populus x berolinensis]|nr:receptor-like protein 7 [Populus alba x Populus x berolinensis]